jgi:hypothetical protein
MSSKDRPHLITLFKFHEISHQQQTRTLGSIFTTVQAKIVHKPGKTNYAADALTRIPWEEV